MSEYSKNYYAENSEKWKNVYNKTDRYKEYHEQYYIDHKGKFIYFIFDEKSLRYIGKTNNLRSRFSRHKTVEDKYEEGNRVIYLDFSDDEISEEQLYFLEQYFIELYKPSKNNRAADYDTNVIDILDDKELIFYEYDVDRNRLIKANEIFDIEDASFKGINPVSKKDIIIPRTVFKAEDVMLFSDVETVERYINLKLEDEDYIHIKSRLRKFIFDSNFEDDIFLLRKAYAFLKAEEMDLAQKAFVLDFYNRLMYDWLSDYHIDEVKNLLDEDEFKLYKKVKGIGEM